MDHPPMENPPPAVRCAQILTNNYNKINRTFSKFIYNKLEYLPGIHLNENYQRSNKLLNSYIWLNFNISDPSTVHSENVYISNKDMSSYMGKFQNIFLEYNRNSSYSVIDMACQFEQIPNPENRLFKNRKKDALGLNRVSINWNLSETEKAPVLRC